jgi:hypothetical protein
MLNCVIKTGFKCGRLIALAMLFLPGMAAAAPLIAIAATNGVPGTTVQVPVLLATDTNLLSAEFDLRFNSKSLTASPPVAGDAVADHMVASCEVKSGVLRVAINSFSHAQLKDGVLVFVPMTIATNAFLGKETLVFTNVALFGAGKDPVRPISIMNGTLTIMKPVHIGMAVTNAAAQGEAHGVAAE